MNPITDGQQPSWRLWGEKKVEGAVYTVYLKKVRYHPGSAAANSYDSEDNVSHLEWETVRVKIIKAGTLEKLVESLANDSGELESTYVNIFLSTYRSFSTPQQVLMLLLDRYKELGTCRINMPEVIKEQHKKTLVQSLLVWLDLHPEDFNEPPQYLLFHHIIDFAQKNLPGSVLELRARHKLEKFKKDEEIKVQTPHMDDIGWCGSCDLKNTSNGLLPYKFHEIPEDHFAQQLTWMDAEVFKKLIPHHCLGSMWSRRDKGKMWDISTNTVTATISQFNAVSLCVVSTILSDASLRPVIRARLLTKWIDIAQELRFLKNFSSLKAIIAALQTNAVYRLKRVWLSVPREKVEVFSELANIFSEDNNQITCRELLIKEGSAKFADTVGENDRQLQKAMQKQLLCTNSATMQGTIPYLGTFLTDLTMIDTAIPDMLGDEMINFDKRRKEFEILAQIKLLQSSANNYIITPDPHFQAWFDDVPLLNENESYDLSCLIEPQGPNSASKEKKCGLRKSISAGSPSGTAQRHKKTDSTSSTSTSSSNSQFYDQISSDISMSSLQQENGHHTKSPSTLRLHGSLPSLHSPKFPSATTVDSSPPSLTQIPEFYIIRVSMQQDCSEEHGVNLYKSIMLSNRDHTHVVIQNAMMKHSIVGDPAKFTLAQLLPNGEEIVFPPSANVYYAINTRYDLNFVLRQRKEDDPPAAQKKSRPLQPKWL